MTMDLTVTDEDLKNLEKTNALVGKAKYAEALRLTRKFIAKHKNKAVYRIDEAVLIGDQPTKSLETHKKQKKKAAKLLRPFVKHARKFQGHRKYFLLNEFYWFSEQPRKQYLLGVKRVKAGEARGYYSQGVGAAFHAYTLMKKKKIKQAQRWADLSERAWQHYFKKVRKDYYNSYCWYALALGLNLKFAEMEKAFVKAAKLSRKPKSYSEFLSFRAMVSEVVIKMS